MNRAGANITHIFIHCSAGFGDLAAMRRFWRTLGWKTDGYHTVVDLDGTLLEVVPFNLPSNGVRGRNANSIHICYRGGVERTNVNKATDSRTNEQKQGLERAIQNALSWIHRNGGNVRNITILGHRDASPDTNGNGVIDSWERIKECPSFDAIPEYQNQVARFLQREQASVPVRTDTVRNIEYVVRSGDSLWGIAQANRVTVTQLRQLNKLNSDVLRVGQRLKIA